MNSFPKLQKTRFEIYNYLFLCVCIYATILIFLYFFPISGYNYLGAQMRRFSEAMLLGIPILFLQKKKFIISYLIFVNLYLLSNVWYYRNYSTLMPLSSYLMVNNLRGLSDSVIDSMRLIDIFIMLPSIIYICLYDLFIYKYRKFKAKTMMFLSVIVLSIVMGIAILTYMMICHSGRERYRFRETPIRALKQYGLIQYWIYQANNYSSLSLEEKEYAVKLVSQYANQVCSTVDNKDSVSFNPNLVLIVVESLCNWPLNKWVDNIEITPFMNTLVSDSNTIYFPRVLPQVKDGRSSDAQLLINTGLLPINTGATSSLYASNKYLSLPKALKNKGYFTASFICDDKEFWNQSAMCQSFGFDRLYDNIGDSLFFKKRSDELLFDKAFELMKDFPMPFYAQLVTISMHKPYLYAIDSCELENVEFHSEEVKNYMIATHYTDKQLKYFVKNLEMCGMLDKSIVVIVGDHDDCTYNKFEGRSHCLLSDRYVPLIIMNGQSSLCDTSKVIGQVDIYPSLLDLMRIHDYPWRGLGYSIYSTPGGAVYHTGDVVGQHNDSIVKQLKAAWEISDLLIRANAFEK